MNHFLSGHVLIHILLSIPLTVCTDGYTFRMERNRNVYGIYQEPRTEYEQYRRRIKKNIIKSWRFLSSELSEIQMLVGKYSPELAHRFTSLLQLGRDNWLALQSDMERIQRADGYAEWRDKEADDLSELMQNRLKYLQNPKNCFKANKLIIPFPGSGFGSQVHTLIYKFMLAYATERTVLLHSRGWCYRGLKSWEDIFSPFSETCTKAYGSTFRIWSAENTAQIVILNELFSIPANTSYFPPTIPADLAPRLKRLHGNPFAWWVGQFLKYVLRPRKHVAKMIEDIAATRKIQRPFVGVHVRRTDKILEASVYPLDMYMAKVEDYYQVLELYQEVTVRRIYLATDDPNVISEMKEKYQNRYEVFSDMGVARLAGEDTEVRCKNESLLNIIFDIVLLSLSDYLVCTLSSNVCRMAYEMMQMFHADASDRIHSLDSSYFYDYQLNVNLTAIYPHRTQDPRYISFDVGDEIHDIINHTNGYSVGVNSRSNEAGWYPSFKAERVLKSYDFPTYPGANVLTT